MKSTLGFIGSVLSWLVILGAAAVILLTVVVPRIAGAEPYTVLTSSMEPSLPPGTLIVVRPVDPESLQVGDVVTVQLESGQTGVVTHRIVEIGSRLDGTLVFATQGDANPSPDSELRIPEQIRGKVWYSIPLIGYVSTFITGQDKQWFVYVVVAGLGAYAVWMFISARRDKRKGEAEEDTVEAPTPERSPAPMQRETIEAEPASATEPEIEAERMRTAEPMSAAEPVRATEPARAAEQMTENAPRRGRYGATTPSDDA